MTTVEELIDFAKSHDLLVQSYFRENGAAEKLI